MSTFLGKQAFSELGHSGHLHSCCGISAVFTGPHTGFGSADRGPAGSLPHSPLSPEKPGPLASTATFRLCSAPATRSFSSCCHLLSKSGISLCLSFVPLPETLLVGLVWCCLTHLTWAAPLPPGAAVPPPADQRPCMFLPRIHGKPRLLQPSLCSYLACLGKVTPRSGADTPAEGPSPL